ncbi:MAG: 3-deoxy-D-manno-octulosonic acid transferase, partial [Planctomycetaceae bacterium]
STTQHSAPSTQHSALNHSAGTPHSALRAPHSPPPVLLLDTLGELSACWGLADVAFVGGSLTNRGGQNMIEPAGYGAAVLFGPNTWNFRDVVESLLARDAARVVAGPEELTAAVRSLLDDPLSARRCGEAAQALVLAQQGAARRTIEALAAVVPTEGGVPASRRRAA